jgi:hemerythrin
METAYPAQEAAKLLEQHRLIRRILDDCERLCEKKAPRSAVDLVGALRNLTVHLEQHNAAEEAALEPILVAADSWGPERIARMLDHHRSEHHALVSTLRGIAETDRPLEKLAGVVKVLVTSLRRHMEAEEQEFLNLRVLRDDLVAADTSDG